MSESAAGLLAEFHKKPGQLPGVIGLLAKGVAVAEALAFEINSVDLIASKPHVPVVAKDALKHLFFQLVHGGAVEFHWRKDAVGVEARLKPGIDAVEVKKRYPFIHLQDVGMVNHIKAVGLMEGCRKFGKKAVCTNAYRTLQPFADLCTDALF